MDKGGGDHVEEDDRQGRENGCGATDGDDQQGRGGGGDHGEEDDQQGRGGGGGATDGWWAASIEIPSLPGYWTI